MRYMNKGGQMIGCLSHFGKYSLFIFIIYAYLCSPRHSVAQSDFELLGGQGEELSWLSTSLVMGTGLDLTPLFDLTAPQESSLALLLKSGGDLHQLKPVLNSEIAQLNKAVQTELSLFPNLNIVIETSQAISTSSRGSHRLMELAQELTLGALQAYRQVDLERAQSSLDAAIELYRQSKRVLIAPYEVGYLYLLRGVISVEQGQLVRGSLAFQKALLIEPTLRLKEGYDNEIVLRSFNLTLDQLRSLSIPELIRLAERPEWGNSTALRVVLVRVEKSVESLLYFSPFSQTTRANSPDESAFIRRELEPKYRERFSWDDPSLASRIASRIWICVPLERRSSSASYPPLPFRLSAGWTSNLLIRSPVSTLAQFGGFAQVDYQLISQLELSLGGMWSNSTRDQDQNLMKSFSAWGGVIGPRWHRKWRRWWASAGLLFQVTRLGETKITREVGCKYFDLNVPLPPEICSPERDIRHISSVWQFGPRLELDGGLMIAQKLMIGFRLFSAIELFEIENSPFGLPIGLGVHLGYSFHS